MARLLLALALTLAGAAAAQVRQEEEQMDEEREEEREEEGARKPPPVLPDRPLMLRVGASHTWDSNIFHAPQASAERIGVAYAGVSVDKAYAQQRFYLDATETASRYQNFSHLDFDALNYRGAWEWRLGPRIGGALSAARAEALADYSEFRNPGVLNVRTTETFLAAADAWLFGGWHVTGGLTGMRDRYTVPVPERGSYRASGGEAGVKWVARSENWVALNLRALDGRYVDRPLDPVALLDDGFRRRETEALALWRFGGKSSVEARAAWIDYRSNNFSARDFSAPAARLRYVWNALAKLSFSAQLGREPEPWADAGASQRVEKRVALGAAWQPTARTTLRLDAIRGESDFRDPPPGFTGAPRHDTQRSAQLEVEWRALRNLSLRAAAQRYRQSSTDPAANYRGSQASAGLSFLF